MFTWNIRMQRGVSLGFVLLVSFARCPNVSSRRTPVVHANCGPVRGLVLRTVWNAIPYSSFKGIPYAKPPIGDLRFQPPVPIDPWKETLNATREGSVCTQIDAISSILMGQEDCLYVNVFTPKVTFRRRGILKPVMVWIYGGAYISGYSNTSLYGPDLLMEEDVVLVSFNYRLGALGFLTLDNPRALGNAGLKDQNLLLQWVQGNIAAFGGDPDKVTIFGQSAGSTSVAYHMLSEKSKGLFLRSISMSGSPLCEWAYHSRDKQIRNAHTLASVLRFTPMDEDDLLNFLLRVPALEIVKATQLVDLGFLPFRPTMENARIAPANSTFLTECPVNLYSEGRFHKHAAMLGTVDDEALLFLGQTRAVNVTDTVELFSKNMGALNAAMMGKSGNHTPLILEGLVEKNIDEITKLATDTLFNAPIDLTQRLLTRKNMGHPVYYYKFTYESTYSVHKSVYHVSHNGTSHCDDLAYVFHIDAIRAPTDPRHPFNRFRKRVVAMWANFAKYGNPTPRGSRNPLVNVTWIESGTSGRQLEIGVPFRMHSRMISPETENFEKFYFSTLPTTSSCKTQKDIDIF